VEGDFIPQQALEKIEQKDAADLVVGILANLDQESSLRTRRGIVILLGDAGSVQAYAGSGSSGKGPQLTFVSWPPIGADTSGTPIHSLTNLSLFLASGARPHSVHPCKRCILLISPMSALCYRPPEEFEREANTTVNSAGATMSFFRHGEIYQSDGGGTSSRLPLSQDRRVLSRSVLHTAVRMMHQTRRRLS
jgi:hypothetical protein